MWIECFKGDERVEGADADALIEAVFGHIRAAHDVELPDGEIRLWARNFADASAREDGEYIAGFVDAAARSLHGMVKGFMERSLAEHRGTHEFTLYAATAVAASHGRAAGIKRLNRLRDERPQRGLHPVRAGRRGAILRGGVNVVLLHCSSSDRAGSCCVAAPDSQRARSSRRPRDSLDWAAAALTPVKSAISLME